MIFTIRKLFLVTALSLNHVLAQPHEPGAGTTANILTASHTTIVNATKTASLPLAARTDNYGSSCSSDVGDGLAGTYFITLQGWGGVPSDQCGQGLLDNLRSHCGDVDNWACDTRDDLDNGAFISFYLSGPKYAFCLDDAIWQASPADKKEIGFCCTWDGFSACH